MYMRLLCELNCRALCRHAFFFPHKERFYPQIPDCNEGAIYFSEDIIEECFPVFASLNSKQEGNYNIANMLKDDGILDNVDWGCEYSCFHATFETMDEAEAFLTKLNRWLTEHWDEHY